MSNFSPAMAVPMTVKMPEPITAPMPSAVSETGPSVFFSAFSGSSESEISLSIDLVRKIWRVSGVSLGRWNGQNRHDPAHMRFAFSEHKQIARTVLPPPVSKPKNVAHTASRRAAVSNSIGNRAATAR